MTENHSKDKDVNTTDAEAPVYMLTTLDNPYNPHTQFDQWYSFDELQGYHTCSYLARIAITSDELSETDENQAIDQAIDEIISINALGIYVKVTKEGFKDRSHNSLEMSTDE